MRRLACALAAAVYRAYFATLRLRYVLPDGRRGRAQDYGMRGHVFAIREGDALALAGLMAARHFAVIVAHGRDGDWASGVLAALGCRVIRGSTRRGGAVVLRALLRSVDESDAPLGIVADGPLGPDGVARPGAVICAARSDRPLMALGVAVTRTFTWPRTWSRMHLPLPFSTVMIAVQPSPVDGADVAGSTTALTASLAAGRQLARLALARHASQRRGLTPGVAVMSDAIRGVTDGVIGLLALPFLLPIWLLPWRAASALGRWYGHAAWLLLPRARRVGALNLRRAYGPAMSRREVRRATRLVFGSLGQAVAEGVQFGRRVALADQAHGLYEFEDPALERRIRADSRARIFVTGHLGSWEVAASLAALRSQRPGAVVIRRMDNRWLDALWQRVRVGRRADWIDKHGAAGEALARLRGGQDVAMLLDENGGYRGIFVPFFGRAASTRKTPAVLSLATGAPIVVAACIRRPGQPFLYRLALLEPDRSLPIDAAVRDLTARVVATYETWIRDTPLQWRWIHWRWKTRPDGTEETYTRADVRRAFQESDARVASAGDRPDDFGWRSSQP